MGCPGTSFLLLPHGLERALSTPFVLDPQQTHQNLAFTWVLALDGPRDVCSFQFGTPLTWALPCVEAFLEPRLCVHGGRRAVSTS